MADNKRGRDAQAHDADERRRERALVEELARGDEREPPVERATVEEVVAGLEDLAFPAAATAVVDAVGDRRIEAADGTYRVADVLPSVDAAFESPDAVGTWIGRPTVAAAMARILEASREHAAAGLHGSQWEAYEKTFRALTDVDAVDDDESVRVLGDWVVERLEDEGSLPGSRALRREAASHCRANGYEVGADEWLGI